MKTIGLLGGMSWESTVHYYQIINEASRKRFQSITEKLKEAGAEGIILGCTELGLLIRQSDVSIPIFDTTVIHAKRAAQIAMEDCVQR